MLKALRKSTLKQRESREEKERRKFRTIKKKKSEASITKAKVERSAKFDSLQKEIEANQVIIEEGIANLSSIQEWSDNYGFLITTLGLVELQVLSAKIAS